MTAGTRKSGFSSLGPISWGTDLCHFYASRGELLSVTAEFLHAGLTNCEAGVWVAPALLGLPNMKVGRRAEPVARQRVSAVSEPTGEESQQPAIGPMIGHEIRNAITPLGLLARLLNSQYGHDDQLTRYALVLSRQANLLGQLAQQLMAPAHAKRVSPPEPESEAPPGPAADTRTAHPAHVNVDDLLVHCIEVAEAGVPRHAPIQLTESDASLPVHGDFGKLTQVFVNVMVNALKYSSATDAVTVMAARAARYCHISVRDNGIGIAPRERDCPLSSQAVQAPSRSNAKASASVSIFVAPSLQRGMLFEEGGADWLRIVRELDRVSLHASHRYLSEPLVAQICAAGMRVLAYMVNVFRACTTARAMGRRHDLEGSHRQTATRHVVHAGQPGLDTTRVRECGCALARAVEFKSEGFQT